MEILLDKVTVNIGVGAGGEPLENAKELLKRLTGSKPVETLAKTRNPTFKTRKGDPIGTKVTLRGTSASEFLKKALDARDFKVAERSFDKGGTMSFGVKEYIEFPGAKYDPKIGMLGFDVCVTLKKPGVRISRRRIASRKLPAKQRVSKPEAITFMQKNYKLELEQ